MAKKNNIRSIRFSDEMMEMIESQAGDSFTAKFEALVTRCMWELPRKEEELRQIQAEIEKEKNLLYKSRDQRQKLERTLTHIQRSSELLKQAINKSIEELETM